MTNEQIQSTLETVNRTLLNAAVGANYFRQKSLNALAQELEKVKEIVASLFVENLSLKEDLETALKEKKELAIYTDELEKAVVRDNQNQVDKNTLLEEGYELINAVYFAHSFDWNLLAQWLDKFNTANGRIPSAQYKTNGCLGHGCNCEKRGQFKCGDSSLESADYSRLGNAFAVHGSAESSKYFVLCLREGCKEMTSNDSQFCDSHRFFPPKVDIETPVNDATLMKECHALVRQWEADKGQHLTGELTNRIARFVKAKLEEETSRNLAPSVSPVGRLQEGSNLTEIKSIMTHLEGSLWQALDSYTQILDKLNQIDSVAAQNASVTKGNSQKERFLQHQSKMYDAAVERGDINNQSDYLRGIEDMAKDEFNSYT